MSKVIVAGSIITDMSVIVEKHPSVGETVVGSNLNYSPGGKGANQAVAAKRLGVDVHMVGKIGDDANGDMSLNFLHKEGIDCYDLTKTDHSSTGIAMIVVSEKTGNNNIVVIPGANDFLTTTDIDNLYKDIIRPTKNDILISQFETPLETTKYFFEKGKKVGTINILNPAPAKEIPRDILKLVDVLIVNETEFSLIGGFPLTLELSKNRNYILSTLAEFSGFGKDFNGIVIITLGENGAIGVIDEKIVSIKGTKVKAIDTTGAGDCFVGAFAAFATKNRINYKEGLKEGLIFANKAAALSVTKKGSGISMPKLQEVED